MAHQDGGIGGSREFPSTCWSMIVGARDPSSPEARRNLERLVQLYWRPVYTVIRYVWSRTSDDAKDLTQEFFATVVFDRELLKAFAPERGSFRSLLRTAVTRFLHDVHKGASRIKRGGGVQPVSLDFSEGDVEVIANADRMSPDELFGAAWKEVVLNAGIARLEKQMLAGGRGVEYEIFKSYDLESDDHPTTYAELANTHKLTVPQVKHALLHARASLRTALTEIVRDYVNDSEELASELRFLLES
jgi:DNA-directed RNA polymerase specialized sigma24 family protein